MTILDGKKLAEKILKSAARRAKKLSRRPGLAVVLVGNNPASESYVRMKRRAAEKCGLFFEEIRLPKTVSEKKLLAEVERLNRSRKIDGFIVQLPLPEKIDVYKVLRAIDPAKDVDGFHPVNHGLNLLRENAGIPPATPAGIIRLIDEYKIDVKGLDAVVIGHSNIVGKPMAAMLVNRGATVTVCHEFTRDLKSHTKKADLIVSATGVAGLVTAAHVKKGAIVFDVGCCKVGDKLVGDVQFEKVAKKASAITPVPGGVGPMTVATLVDNTVAIAEGKFKN